MTPSGLMPVSARASRHRQPSHPSLPVHLVVVVVSGSGVLPASTNNSRPFIGPRAYSFTDGRLSEAIFAGSRGTLVWCEPMDLLVCVRERPLSRARGGFGGGRARGFAAWCAWEAVFAGSQGFWGGASPGICWLVCVGGHLCGLAIIGSVGVVCLFLFREGQKDYIKVLNNSFFRDCFCEVCEVCNAS